MKIIEMINGCYKMINTVKRIHQIHQIEIHLLVLIILWFSLFFFLLQTNSVGTWPGHFTFLKWPWSLVIMTIGHWSLWSCRKWPSDMTVMTKGHWVIKSYQHDLHKNLKKNNDFFLKKLKKITFWFIAFV